MISPGTFIARCDGIDRTTGDICKASVALTLDLADLSRIPAGSGRAAMTSFFVARLDARWGGTCDGKIFCENCKP